MINKYKLADQMRNSMHIPDEFLPNLDTYMMVHYPSPKFKTELKDGQIDINGTKFDVIYHQCTPARAKKAKEVRCSFREADYSFNIHPIVLVQVVID